MTFVTYRDYARRPGDVRVAYTVPELFLFRPQTLHGWSDIEEDTLMAACLVA